MTDHPILLVTGGSRGIGAAVSRLAAMQGYHVIVNFAHGLDAASALVGEIRAAGGQADAIRADIGFEEEIALLFSEIDRRFGRLDGLVNNAGIVDQAARLDEMDRARLEPDVPRQHDRRHAGGRRGRARMSTRNGGRGGAIVNISSMAAVIGAPSLYVDYAASKAAIDTLTVGLAREVATEGIRVNAVRPGVIETELHATGGLPDRPRDMAPQIPMQRPGLPDEVAERCFIFSAPRHPM